MYLWQVGCCRSATNKVTSSQTRSITRVFGFVCVWYLSVLCFQYLNQQQTLWTSKNQNFPQTWLKCIDYSTLVYLNIAILWSFVTMAKLRTFYTHARKTQNNIRNTHTHTHKTHIKDAFFSLLCFFQVPVWSPSSSFYLW